MALTRIPTKGIADNAVSECKVAPGAVTTAKIGPAAVTAPNVGPNSIATANITDGTIVNADISPSAAIASGKLSVCTAVLEQNISLLGFKMAVNEGLTVFNLVDGVVDEFHDESGTDEAEGSNDHYSADCDFYSNNNAPATVTSSFTTTTVTNSGSSTAGTAGTNPTFGSGTLGSFTVASGVTSVNAFLFGAGGAANAGPSVYSNSYGGGGGLSKGTLAVSPGQTLYVSAGEGGSAVGLDPATVLRNNNTYAFFGGGALGHIQSCSSAGSGGGLTYIGQTNSSDPGAIPAPSVMFVAGSGGGGSMDVCYSSNRLSGGGGGGLTGFAGYSNLAAQTSNFGNNSGNGGGGDQEQGGQGGGPNGSDGAFLKGGEGEGEMGINAGGGAGYYGGGGGSGNPQCYGAGGGGSSYYGHPQVTSGATEAAGYFGESGGVAEPSYGADTSEGGFAPSPGVHPGARGEDGFILIQSTGQQIAQPGGGSSTIISNAFTASSVPTTSRIVVFEENVDSPTLNTDIIASRSRDGGSNYTTATLSDSGYVTGSSGQRILTGQATISGQPSGQSMRWKLALANNTVKIHGVSLQWA